MTIHHYSPLFTTVHHYSHYSRLFKTICTIWDYSLFATIRYSPLAICDYSLFTNQVFKTPDYFYIFYSYPLPRNDLF